MKKIIVLSLAFICTWTALDAQYFGRNKPRYRSFDFEVVKTPHFQVYHYFDDKSKAEKLGQLSEMWYEYHKDVLQEDLVKSNPMIFYANHADFQMTNTISGGIGVGTGGVTEAFKNRIIMPVAFTNQQTNQVLGHEMVHAFQFNSILNGDSTSLSSLGNLPLWLVEGMAEYMSLGRVDPYTAMWMRDAILNDDVPTIKQMANLKYFPYRYGQAMWSFLTGYYGDGIIKPFFKATAIFGLGYTIDSLMNTNVETLDNMWQSSLKNYYEPFLRDQKEDPQGKLLFSQENSGRINVSPSLSPDGRYVIFLSEKDLFSTDLFLANARSGEIIRKVASLVNDSDLDNLNMLESAGTWDPRGQKFAFIAFKKGRHVIVIKDVENGKTIETINVPGVPAMAGPTWSPDGKNIVVTGLVDGQTDLYMYNFKSKRVTQLTDDEYSEIHADYSDDGRKIVFSYDRKSMDRGRTFGKYTMDLAVMDVETQRISTLNLFHRADNINPQFDHEGNIYFMSDRDGYRNLYRYILSTGEVMQMTDLLTGISGITRYSPAISVSHKRDRVLYTHYYGGKYQIYEASTNRMLNKVVASDDVNFDAGTLPVVGLDRTDIVNANLIDIDNYNYADPSTFEDVAFEHDFKLDFIGGGGGIGVSTGNIFGNYTGLQGGVQLLFSDILGNHQLFTNVAMNGEILDVGGQFAYLNRKGRVAWGASLSHIPLRTGFAQLSQENRTFDFGNGPQTIPVLRNSLNIIRIFDDGIDLFAHLPFSSTLRLEGGIGGRFRYFRYDIYDDFYVGDPVFGFQLVDRERTRQEIGDQISFNQFYTLRSGYTTSANIALVGDNSYFGLTAPLAGHRFRLGVDYNYGADRFYSVILDARKYKRIDRFSLAVRGTSYLRWQQTENSVFPIFIGDMQFVRGYGSIFNNNFLNGLDSELSQLIGTKMAMTSVELRLPFVGPRSLAVIPSNTFFADLNLFFDAGVAFDNFSDLSEGNLVLVPQRNEDGSVITDASGNIVFTETTLKPLLATSLGVSMRVNLFGALILEPYYAFPLATGGGGRFGLNLVPGW